MNKVQQEKVQHAKSATGEEWKLKILQRVKVQHKIAQYIKIVQHEKKCKMKIVQYEESATWKGYNMEIVHHQKSAT